MEPIKGKRRPMSDINVVPYRCHAGMLLIIFMVTAPMLIQGLKFSYPRPMPMRFECQ